MKISSRHCILWIIMSAICLASCEEKQSQNVQTELSEDEIPVIELVSPGDDSVIDLAQTESVEFEWTAVDGVNSYKILIGKSEDMSGAKEISAVKNPMSVKSETIDSHLQALGFGYEATAEVYWSVVVWGNQRANTGTRRVTFKRLPEDEGIPYEERIADKLTIPVAVLIEDPVIPSTGKKITDTIFPNWGFEWYDPYVQMEEFERDMENSSHNVVEYEVVKIVEADRLFSYHKQTVSTEEKEYLTIDTLANHYLAKRIVDGISEYDYIGMMEYYGFDDMVDNGEIKEVWVYTHPASGMYESRLIGDGAFWCNSGGIGAADGAPCKELCCVMFCNYERTTDLAMHSYAHRVESIMNQVYGDGGWNYNKKLKVEELTNWEKFSAHHNEYSKFKEGYAHIGMCHWPPNSEGDYDYGNTKYVYTYADTWFDYPDIKEDDSVARRVNKNEWQDAGGDQWGYMKWYFGHIPHFKGLCERDLHLNNWWYYIVDYNAALKYERLLRNEQL